MKIKLLLFITLFITTFTFSKVLKVPQDFPTIQAAIDASGNSDTVLVSEGIYFENIRFNGKGILLTSNFFLTKDWNTVKNTIIDGSKCVNKDTASTVQFLNNEDSTSILDGFTITGGTGTRWVFGSNTPQEGGGIILAYSSAIIRNNIITKNMTKTSAGIISGGGGGISSMYGNPKIFNNIIMSNTSGYAGGVVLNWSKGEIKNNIIYHNYINGQWGGGGIMVWQSPDNGGIVENNTIIGNISTSITGGIAISVVNSSQIPVIKNNIVWGNRQASGKQVTNLQYLKFNTIEDQQNSENISVYPEFEENSFMLPDLSHCVDAGDTSESYNDKCDLVDSTRALFPSKGNLRNDIGAFGGKLSKLLTTVNATDLYVSAKSTFQICEAGKEKSIKIELFNLSTCKVTIDSVVLQKGTDFKINEVKEKTLLFFQSDTLILTFRPTKAGILADTIKIYHQAEESPSPIIITVGGQATATTGNILDNKSSPLEYNLFQNYPNPFNPATIIKFSIKETSPVTLKIYNVLGKEIDTIINKELDPGIYSFAWTPGNMVCTGIYLAQLITGNFKASTKMLYQK